MFSLYLPSAENAHLVAGPLLLYMYSIHVCLPSFLRMQSTKSVNDKHNQ